MGTVLSVIQIIFCIIIIGLVLAQESPRGASGALTGSADTDTHFDKIKGRTSGVMVKKATAITGILLAVTTLLINIV